MGFNPSNLGDDAVLVSPTQILDAVDGETDVGQLLGDDRRIQGERGKKFAKPTERDTHRGALLARLLARR
jgi:hypothetical protein